MAQPRAATTAGAVLAALFLLSSSVCAHVLLRYPPTGIPLDFLDNLRTEDLCGVHPNRVGEAASWQVPDFNTSVKTTAVAGSTLDVSWDLHYAHNGGFKLELYDAEMNKILEWAPEDHMGCNVDATKQNVTIDLPAEPCTGCVLRFQRQALEWGANYLFRSCALLDIVAEAGTDAEAACNGCSGHGTCTAGACECDSSAETGFFYGAHCEYEDECEADTDCGTNGKCVNVGDVSGPANQCFCEAGFFGDVVTMPSGMQRRTCDRASTLTLDTATLTWETFGEDYNRSIPSASDNFAAHLNPGTTDVEFAMQGKTSSWVAMGLRSAGAAGGAAAPAAADAEGAAAEGADAEGADAEGAAAPAAATAEGADAEPAASAEAPAASAEAPAADAEAPAEPAASAEAPSDAEPAAEDTAADAEPPVEEDAAAEEPVAAAEPPTPVPDAEPEARRRRSSSRRRLASAARALASAEAEAPAADGEAPAAADAEVPAAADGEPAADGEAAAEGGDAAAEGEGAAAEGEGDAGADACTAADIDVATLVVPGALGPGTIPTDEGEAGEAAAEGEADAETAARRLRSTSSMPLVQAEAAVTSRMSAMHSRRDLLEATAEGADAEAEGEGAVGGDDGYKPIDFSTPTTLEASDPTVGAVEGGPCAGYSTTPGTAHAMVNQDVVFGAAREIDGVQYFRIVDMFTPSRSKPQPDHMFCDGGACGSDDIQDAIGAEVDGYTYIKFTRAAMTEDAVQFTDTCISEDQTYHAIYALGQLTNNASHTPASALEVLPADSITNQDFYKADELKYHGGGIGAAFPGRGILGTTLNLFSDEAAAAGGECTASTLAPEFECMVSQLDGNVIVHYNTFVAGDTSATLAAETPSETGWVALGFHPEGSPMMIGSTAVIGTGTAADGVAVFDLNEKAATGIIEADGATTVAARRLRQASNIPFSVTDASVERAGGKTTIRFTREFDDTFTGEGPIGALAAYHSTESELGTPHEGRTPFELSLAAGAATDAAAGPAGVAGDAAEDETVSRGGVDGAATEDGESSGAAHMSSVPSVLGAAFLGSLGVLFLT